LLSVAFLRSILRIYHWAGMLSVVVGMAIVGAGDILYNTPEVGNRNYMISGDLLVIIATIIVSVQMVYEQKVITKHNVSPLLAVGIEGLFGLILMTILLIPMYYIRVPMPFTQDMEGRLENPLDAYDQIQSNTLILVSLAGGTISMTAGNFAGMSVSKELSSTTRAVIGPFRVVIIWAVSLAVGWQSFILLQLLGFAVLIFGLLVYNDILIGPVLREYVVPWWKQRGLSFKHCWHCCCPTVTEASASFADDGSLDDRSVIIN